MMALVAIGSLTLGATVPRAIWRWPILVGGILPVASSVVQDGPYAFDVGDRWIPLAAAVVFTVFGAAFGRLVRWAFT
jgi:hypothetical protein